MRKGDPLFELYSPDLVNAQQEYLQALASGNNLLFMLLSALLAEQAGFPLAFFSGGS